MRSAPLSTLMFVFAATLAGCAIDAPAEPGEELSEAPPAIDEGMPAAELEVAGLAEQDVGAGCPDKSAASPLEADPGKDPSEPGPAPSCVVDLYFHPNNGSHGGWIEARRLCPLGGNQYRICTGGYAPVRYWNASGCGGTVHAYYPQGWSGWAQTSKCC